MRLICIINIKFNLFSLIRKIKKRDDLWLNEAMASFLEHKAVHSVYPEMDIVSEAKLKILFILMLCAVVFFFNFCSTSI